MPYSRVASRSLASLVVERMLAQETYYTSTSFDRKIVIPSLGCQRETGACHNHVAAWRKNSTVCDKLWKACPHSDVFHLYTLQLAKPFSTKDRTLPSAPMDRLKRCLKTKPAIFSCQLEIALRRRLYQSLPSSSLTKVKHLGPSLEVFLSFLEACKNDAYCAEHVIHSHNFLLEILNTKGLVVQKHGELLLFILELFTTSDDR